MVNYQLGKIYKIACRITGEVYVGSTCEKTLARRLAAHRQDYKQFEKKKRYTSSFKIISRGNYYIDLLENYPCSSNDELHKKEREYYDNIDCVNIFRPIRFDEDLKDDARLKYMKRKEKHLSDAVIDNRKLGQQQRVNIQKKNKEKYKAKIAANPNHIEEMKARHKEQQRISGIKFRKRVAEKKRLEKGREDTA